jgi:hypothetical protein
MATRLAYRDVVIYGLLSKPHRITVNENSNPIDSSKTQWDPVGQVSLVHVKNPLKA